MVQSMGYRASAGKQEAPLSLRGQRRRSLKL